MASKKKCNNCGKMSLRWHGMQLGMGKIDDVIYWKCNNPQCGRIVTFHRQADGGFAKSVQKPR